MDVPTILFAIGTVIVVLLLFAMIWLGVTGDREDEHWPVGLDEDPTLSVTNGIGDSRPLR